MILTSDDMDHSRKFPAFSTSKSFCVYIYIYNIIQSYIYINQGVGQISATHPPPDNRPCTTAAVDAQWSHLASPPVSFPLLSD